MEVFPPDDPQSNDVGSRPTVSQIEQLKSWDDSFTNLERVLQAACEKSNESHNDLNSCSRDSTVQCIPDTVCSINTTDIKRKLETDLLDSIEANKQKLNCMNNILNSGEVTIQLVNSSQENCDNIPISNLLSIKTETKTKYDDFTFQMSSEKIHSDTKNTIEFIKLDPKPEIKDENLDLKIEKKPDIFPDLDKSSCIKEESNFSSDIKLIVSGEIKSDSGFTDDLSTESKSDFYPQNDPLSYNLKEENSDLKSECPLLTEVSSVLPNKVTAETSPCVNDNKLFSCNTTENNELSSEEIKEEKDKKEEAVDKNIKKEDKFSKKKKFERCNIRDIKLEEELDAVTLSAQKEEQERIRRLQEAQMRALQERLHQIEVEKEALSQLFSQSAGDTPGLFDSNALSEADVSIEKKVKTENDVVLEEGSDEDKKAKIQDVLSTAIAAPIEENIIDISSSSSGNESDSEDSDKKDDDVMVLSDEGEEGGETAEDPNNSGAHTNDCFNLPDEEGRVLVNVGHPPEDPDIFLAPQIAKVIKPHQIGGIRFLYDNVVENLERYKSSPGFGCILAHSMGLGKTVQVVSFVDVFLRHTPATLVLCIVPINTIQNWKAEFDMWVPPSNCVDDTLVLSGEVRPRDYNIYTLNENFKTMAARASLIAEWQKNGGVLLMGYEMYRMLALRKMPKIPAKKSKKMKKLEMNLEPETNEQIKKYMEEMYEHIVIPGPDLVICDEGHRIKNSLASTSMALKSIKTRRRVVLTGYPLQNNLLEYWCMVDFVRPNYLGTRAEFCNMFERPISNGQCIDSTPRDRQLMRFRSHVLHSLLVGFVQRRGHSVLRAVLPKKEEHVLLIRMTPIQRQLYKCFVKDLLYVQQATNPLKLFAVCCKIWNHPDILYKLLQEKKAQEDIDLDIDITVAGNTGVSSSNCGIKKRSYQSKSKVSQRSLKALPRNLKNESNSFNNGSIKSESTSCDPGSSQQANELKFDSRDSIKDEFNLSNQNNTPSQSEYSLEGTQSFQNSYALKGSMNSQFGQSNYDLSFGMQYSLNNQNSQYGSKNNLAQQFNSEANSQSSQNMFPQSSALENQYGPLSQKQFSLGNNQNFTQADSQIKSSYVSETNVNQNASNHLQSPSQNNYQSKCQSYSSQSNNCSNYPQQVDLVNQMQNSNQESFPVQSNSNVETSFQQPSLTTNQKFTASQQYPQTLQPYSSSQQFSQEPCSNNASRLQFPEQQPSSQFSTQSVSNKSKTNYSQVSNQSSPTTDASNHHSSSQSPFQPSPPQSQFPRTSQASSSTHSQFSQQSSYSQVSQQYDQQQSSPTQSQFSQVYTNQFSQQPSEFTQPHSNQQFQQQTLQTFSEQQIIESQFQSSDQSYTTSDNNYNQQTPVQQYSQAFLESGQSYSQQTSHENITSNFGTHQFSSQVNKFANKQEQQNISQTELNNENIQYSSQSAQSVGQKQVDHSSPDEKECNNPQAYHEQVSGLSHLSQSNTPSFTEQISNVASQYTVQQTSSLQFSSQATSSSQYSSQTNKQGESCSSLHFPHQKDDSSEQYVQSSHQYNQQTPATPQYSQQSEQNAQQPENSEQNNSNSQIFQQSDQISQHNSHPQKTFNQQLTQNSELCSQNPDHNVNQYNQQFSSFPSQQSELTQLAQLSHPQQYSHHSSDSNEQFLQQSAQTSQQYNQASGKSSQIYGLQSIGSAAHQYPQQVSQSSQELNQQSSHSQQLNQHPQTSPQYNQQSITSQMFGESVAQTSQMFNQLTQSQQYDSLSESSEFNQTTMQPVQQFGDAQSSQQINQSSIQSSSHLSQVSLQSFDKPSNQNSQQYNQSNQPPPYSQSANQSSQFNQSANQSSQFNQSVSHSQFNQSAGQSSQYNQLANQSSQYNHSASQSSQFNQSASQSSQFNQLTNQSSEYNQSTNQSSQYNQSANQSSQYNQSTNQSSQYNQSANQSSQYNQASNQSSQYNQAVNQSSQYNEPMNQSSQYNQLVNQPSQFNQSANQPSQFNQSANQPSQFNQSANQPSQFNQSANQPSQFNQSANQPSQFNQPANQPSQFNQSANQPSQFNQSANQPSQFNQSANQPSQFNQSANQPSQFNQSANQPSQFNQSANQPSQFNQTATQPSQFNQTATQPSQFNQAATQSSQFNQSASQSSQFTQSATQSSQYSQPYNQASPYSQPSNQTSPYSHSANQSSPYSQTTNQSSQYNQLTNQSPQFNQIANQSSQQFNTASQIFNQASSQTSKQSHQPPPYNQNPLSNQQFNQSSQSQFVQKNLQAPQYSQQIYSQTSQSPQHYSQQPAQSPQHFSQPAQSPQQFSQPVQSPQQFQQQPAQSPQQYSQHPVQSPQHFNQPPAQSPQQYQQTSLSPQQFSQPPAPSPQQYQSTAPSPQQFLQQSTASPQQFSQHPVPSPQHLPQQPAPSPQQFSQPAPSPQQFSQPAPSPQQFSQTVPSPQQFSQTNSSPQQYSQPTPSPQQFTQPTPSPQQFSQHTSQQFPPPTPPSQQFSQLSPSSQQFSQPTPPPQQFSQPIASPQHFSQTNQSPQQYSHPAQSPKSLSHQSTSSQSNPTSQQFPSSSTSSQQLNQQVSQNPQTHYMQQTPSQHFSQPPLQSPTNSQYPQLSSQTQYKQQTGQLSQYSVQQQCMPGSQNQQFSSTFSQLSRQSSVKSPFQSDYQNQTGGTVSSHNVSNQNINQQSNKQVSRGCKNKQSRIKPISQALPPQTSHQSNLKQPPSFSVQAFQNGNPSNALHRNAGQQSIKSLQDSGNSLLQPHQTSASNQETFSLQHISQDTSGTYSGKCPKAILQTVKHQNQDPSLHSQINSDALQNESELKSVANVNDSAIVPFRDRMDSSINYEWAVPIMKDYVLGVLENSHKMMVLFVIIAETLQMGDKLLVFSQSLSTLDLLEQFLSKIQVPRKPDQPDQIVTETWSRNKNYFRLDGSTSAQEREKLINEFNRNDNVSLFLLSTRAGCLGINLVGANRIVVMDASWNPCHDAQAVCRIYRYGQKKQCYIYRLVTDNSLEKRIYDRQVNKQGMSDRVVDELNPESNFTWKDVTTLIQDDEDDGPVLELSKFSSSYTDRVLKYLVSEMSPSLSKEPFEHESLLLDRKDLKLTKQEKRLAKQSYEMAKRANMINIRTTYTYLPAGSANGSQFIINNKQCQWVGGTTIRVLPNQNNSGAANTRSGTTATPITASPTLMSSLFKQGVMVQKLTMPSNVSIPVLTPGAPPVVIPAGQDVLVLRTPKGVYLRLPDGRIIAVQLPPSLLAKTQFRPNVVTHFRPATPKGGNHSTTVINTPRGQSIGIIKQTLQCGGTVRYLGPRNAAGSSGHNSSRGSAPEVIDLSDDEEPSLRKHGIASNASANSSESESGSGDLEKPERQPTIFPGKHITIRKISPNSNGSASKEKCEIPQVLSKNKQITILPINPSAQQNRQKFAPQLAQPVRVQQMLLQPQQGKRKPIQKNPAKVQISPLIPGKSVRPQIPVTHSTSSNSNFQLQKIRHPLSIQPSKNIDFIEKNNEQSISSVKPNSESSSIKMSERNSKASPIMLPQSLQNNKNSSVPVSESGKIHGSILPPSLAALAVNPNLQITPASCADSLISDSGSQKSGFSTKPPTQNSNLSYLQNESLQNSLSANPSLQITPTSCPETSDSHLLKAVQHSKTPNLNMPATSGALMDQCNTVSSNKHVLSISSSSESTTVSDTLSQRTLFYSKSPIQNSTGFHTEQTSNIIQSFNHNLQITPVPHSEPSSTSDLFSQPKPIVQSSPHISHDIHDTNTATKSSHLHNKMENSSPQISIPQTFSNKTSTLTISDSLSTASSSSSLSSASQVSTKQIQSSTHSSFQQILSTLTNSDSKQKPQTSTYSSQSLPNTLTSTVSSVSVSQSQHTTSRKRKSSNKQPSKKSQQQHLLMSQNHMLQSQTMDTSQPFLHPQLSEHLLSENHFPTFPHHISGTDFTTFSNFSSHKTAAHIQHPQPLHPLQHSQEHSLLPHLQHMSHLYPIPPHLTGTSSLSDTQPPAPRAWPVPQPSVSSFHPFSQSSPFFSSGQESSQLSFPSSFPLPPSTLTPSLTQSDSNSNVASINEKSSRLSTSNM